MKLFSKTLNFIFILLIFSCAKTKSVAKEKEYINKGYSIAKVVDNSEIAGCGYLLQLNDSSYLSPIDFDNKYKKNSLKVYIKYEVLKKQPTTNCMRGKAAKIIEIVVSD